MMKTTNTTSTIFYLSFMEALIDAGLSEELRCQFYEGLLLYATKGEMPVFSHPFLKGFFRICKENIDANNRKNLRRSIASANGQKGGAPKGNQNAAKKKKQVTAAAEEKAPQTLPDAAPEEDAEELPEMPPKKQPKTTQKTTEKTSYNTMTDTDTDTNTKTSFFYQKDRWRKKTKKDDFMKRNINERNEEFLHSLTPYIARYGNQAIHEFYDFWSEPNRERTLMKFEMERTWELQRRLDNWIRKREQLSFGMPHSTAVY